ncbi:MAG: Gfo/Idh/MocA family oxidoreductase, partial [Nitrososphaerales archaeon]
MKNSSSYELLLGIRSLKFDDRSVLIVGAGWMARQYALALSKMHIKDVTILSKSEERVVRLCHEFGFNPLAGGYEKHLRSTKRVDLLVVATPVHVLLPATKLAVKHGQRNILVEKPGSLYRQELLSLARTLRNQRVRVAYNRLLYPNLHMLKQLLS